MIEYKQRRWEDLDLQALTSLTKDVFNYEGRGEFSSEQIERHLTRMNERFPSEVVFVATDNGKLIGWTGVQRQTENIGELGRWHPYVADTPKKDEIAESLLSDVMKYAKENSMNRLEISFGDISDKTIKAYNKRCSWLKSLNWNLVDDTLYMEKDPSESIQKVNIPDGFTLHPLLENDDDAIYECHHASFTTSKARFFYTFSEAEKRQNFNKIYDRTKSINADASFVLKKGDTIVGILLSNTRDDEEYISVVAVHPDYRGKGLAKALLTKGIKEFQKTGTSTISIGVDAINTPAAGLYKKFGFKIESRLSYFSWSVDST